VHLRGRRPKKGNVWVMIGRVDGGVLLELPELMCASRCGKTPLCGETRSSRAERTGGALGFIAPQRLSHPQTTVGIISAAALRLRSAPHPSLSITIHSSFCSLRFAPASIGKRFGGGDSRPRLDAASKALVKGLVNTSICPCSCSIS
jgi:hypothetical protein